MEKYAEYKGSDLPWIKVLPTHWKSTKIKFLSKMQSGNNIAAIDITDEGEYPVYGGNGLRGYTSTATHMDSHILIGRQGALCGNVRLVTGPFYATEHAIVVYTNSLTDAKQYAPNCARPKCLRI